MTKKNEEDDAGIDVTPEQLAAIDEGIAALERGESVDWDEWRDERRRANR